jgi:hypothetical protein
MAPSILNQSNSAILYTHASWKHVCIAGFYTTLTYCLYSEHALFKTDVFPCRCVPSPMSVTGYINNKLHGQLTAGVICRMQNATSILSLSFYKVRNLTSSPNPNSYTFGQLLRTKVQKLRSAFCIHCILQITPARPTLMLIMCFSDLPCLESFPVLSN